MASAALLRRIRTIAAEWWPARVAVRILASAVAPRNCIGAVGVVFDGEGRVLLVEHAFRTDYPWGLPGGWIERGEDPGRTVARELKEELGLDVEVVALVHGGLVDRVRTSTHPVHLGLAYYCRLRSESARLSVEVLGFGWVDPASLPPDLAPFQRDAILRATRLHNAGS